VRNLQARFEELVVPHLGAAYRLARLLVKRDEGAQDVVQDRRAAQGLCWTHLANTWTLFVAPCRIYARTVVLLWKTLSACRLALEAEKCA